MEFATTWPTYDLDAETRALLAYATLLTEAPMRIDDAAIERSLWTHGLPPVDLVIRTSGEQRVSNFLLWQLAYTEFYFTDLLWPDFGRAALHEAFASYRRRERRFGRTSEQVQALQI